MTNLQAAVGVGQIEKIDSIIAAKRRIAANYKAALAIIPGLTLPVEPKDCQSVFWLISLCIDPTVFGMDRDQIMTELKKHGIETRPVFPVVHQQPIYAAGPHAPTPVADLISARGLSLPSDASLTRDEIKRVADTLYSLHLAANGSTATS